MLGGATVLGNFQYWSVLLWIKVGQGPTVLAVGASGDCLFFISISLGDGLIKTDIPSQRAV